MTTEQLCDCGNYPVLPGLRVCDSCKFAGEMYPELFEDDEPDRLPFDGENGLTDKRYEVIAATIHYGLGALVRDCEDAPGALQNDVQPMAQELLAAYEYERYMHAVMDAASRVNAERGNEFETAYEHALQTISALKESLRNIHLTASKAGNEPVAALAWIESETSRVLKATLEALA